MERGAEFEEVENKERKEKRDVWKFRERWEMKNEKRRMKDI